jgi:hypothetical protein
MKMQSKKLISLILAVVLVLGVFPMAGFATGEEGPVNEPPAITQTPGEQTGDESTTPTPADADETATPTPVVTDEAASTTPVATPALPEETATPTPTPTPKAVVLADLRGEELYAYLLTLNGDELTDTLGELTQAQIDSLQGYATQAELSKWFPQVLDFTKMTAAEIADYLRALESNQTRINAWIELTALLDADKMAAIAQEFAEDEFASLFSVTGTLLGAGVAAEDFSNAGALIQAAASSSTPKLKSMAGGFSTMTVSDTGIQLNKTASILPNENYKIRLESYTTGTVTTQIKPADIVLVLDVSSSMNDPFSSQTVYNFNLVSQTTNSGVWGLDRNNLYFNLGDNTYTQVTVSYTGNGSNRVYTYSYVNAQGTTVTLTSNRDNGSVPLTLYIRTSSTVTLSRLQALQAAVNNFIDSTKLQNDSMPSGTKHRIAIVTFSTTAQTLRALTTVDAAGATNLKSAVNGLQTVLYTRSDLGMEQANTIITGSSSTKNQVVVMFTDGVPTSNSASFSDTVATNAIYQSKLLKDKGATVYTVGIFAGAAVNAGGALPGTNNETNKANRYMHLTSSNYPSATSLTNIGTGGATGIWNSTTQTWTSYYLAASDASALNTVFQGISQQVGDPTVRLGLEARIQDTLSDYFRLTTPNNITVKTADASYSGGTLSFVNETVVALTPTVNGKTISVSGFNFDDNYVSENGRGAGNSFHGKMLIVEIEVEREPSFIGGNNVDTNVPETSGLYDNDTSTSPRQKFGTESPIVNVPIIYNTATVQNRDIYAGDDVTLASLLGGDYTTSSPGSTYTLGDAVTNQYADVAYTIYDGAIEIGTYTVPATATIGSASCSWTGTSTIPDLTADKTYTVTATVTPSQDPDTEIGSAGSIEDLSIGTAYVNVYTPTVTPRDLSVYLTRNPTQEQLNTAAISGAVWKHGDDTADEEAMGDAPGLTYTFSGLPASPDYPTADTGISITSVTRTDGDMDVLTEVSTIGETAAAPAGSHLKLFILKPVVTCSDTTVFLGDTTDLDDRYALTGWTWSTGAPDVADPFLTVPIFVISPVFVAGSDPASHGGEDYFAPKVDSNFKVKVEFAGADLVELGLCTVMNNGNPVTGEDFHFTVFVVAGQLTITKSVTGVQDDECFLFTVTVTPENGNPYTFKEVIEGSGSKVIKGLPKGTYSVSEDTAWSWHYNTTTGPVWDDGDTISFENRNIACTITNSSRTPYWLSDDTLAVNWFAPYNPVA